MNCSSRLLGGLFRTGCLAISLVLFAGASAQSTTTLRSPGAAHNTPTGQRLAPAPTSSRQQPPAQASGIRYPAPRQASYGFPEPQRTARSFIPRHQRTVAGQIGGASPPEAIEGPIIYEDGAGEMIHGEMIHGDIIHGDMFPGDMHLGSGPPYGDCCGPEPFHHWRRGCLIPCPIVALENMEIFGGAHGFTGPANRGESGSFGFHEGINLGVPLPCLPGEIGGQVGYQAVHSNFSGAEFTNRVRNQSFLTAGLFRRVDWGLQGGLVVDYMSDDWYYKIDLVQLRGELSWVFPQRHEVGFWFTAGTRTAAATSKFEFNGLFFEEEESWEPTDLYAFFYRIRVQEVGGEARVFGGFSGESDGLIGGDVRLPIGENWAFETMFTYLIPEQGRGTGLLAGHAQEAWNVAFNVVWRPGRRPSPDYYRPLFRVADNGSFLFDRITD